jgi:glycine/D-amino acid oxidase-like deaminating enzyme
MNDFDIVIVGLGVHGSACAREFAEQGWRVLGVDCSRAGEVVGASVGPTRMVREIDPHHPRLTPLAIESVERWKRLRWSGGRSPFQQSAGVFIGGPKQELMPADNYSNKSIEKVTVDHPLLGGLALESDCDVIVDRRCGLLTARSSVLALRYEARYLGAEFVFGVEVQLRNVRSAGRSRVIVRLGNEEVYTSRLLICVGPWSVKLPGWTQIPGVETEPGYMQTAMFREGTGMLGEGAFYVIYDGPDRFCIISFANGNSLQFGHFCLPESSAFMGPAQLAEASWNRDVDRLRSVAPRLGNIAKRATIAAAYTLPPGEDFVLGWVAPHVATLVACSRVGFKFAPAVATRVVTAICGGDGPTAGLRVEDYI